MKGSVSVSFVAGLLAIGICAAAVLRSGTASADTSPLSWPEGCPRDMDRSKLNDYRRREMDPYLSWSVRDIKANHYDPAIARMRAGEISREVIGDLHFILRGWPNHLPAIQALIEYDQRGGRQYGFLPTECYLFRARLFAPDDIEVILAHAYYYWRRKNLASAQRAYEDALRLDSESASAHYNLGLVYFETSDYQKSLEHALKAYDRGFPLPGLRDKLIKSGHWPQANSANQH
jgi:tetratricopeptide (TPR) repeat protein